MQVFFSWSEARRFYAIGLPIFVAQMAQTGMTLADTVMTGQYSAEAMAAVAVAGSVWGPLSLLGIGCLFALPPLSAQCVGGGRPKEAAHLLRQGFWLTLGLNLVLLSFFYGISHRLGLFGLTPRMAALSGEYLRAIMWGLPGFMIFVNLRSFLEGFSRTRPAMIIGLLALFVNVPCNYVLIYGKLGFPAMGAAGCGWASTLSYWFMAISMFFYICRDPQYQRLGPLFSPLFQRGDKPRCDVMLLLRLLRIGIPGALALFFEVALFACSAILLAPLGATTVAGHQVAINYGAVIFMIPLSISMTATIRVGHCLGAQQVERARLVARTALILALGAALLIAALTAVLRQQIVAVYTDDMTVAALAAHLLLFVTGYQLVDALQTTSIGILRGYNDTRCISVFCFLAYGVMGLPLGYLMGRTDALTPAMGAPGFWIAYIVALGCAGCCYAVRLYWWHGLAPKDVLARVRR